MNQEKSLNTEFVEVFTEVTETAKCIPSFALFSVPSVRPQRPRC